MESTWFWYSDDDKSWMSFCDDDNSVLEREHSAGSDCAVLTRNGHTYYLDLRTMKQTNMSTNYVRKVHRGWPDIIEPPVSSSLLPSSDEEDEDGDDEDDDDDDDDDDEQEDKNDDDENDPVDIEMDSAAPSYFICPLTHSVMKDPVMTTAGSTFERKSIEKWLKKNRKDPLTNQEVKIGNKDPNLIVNRSLREAIDDWKVKYMESRIAPPSTSTPSSMLTDNVSKDVDEKMPPRAYQQPSTENEICDRKKKRAKIESCKRQLKSALYRKLLNKMDSSQIIISKYSM